MGYLAGLPVTTGCRARERHALRQMVEAHLNGELSSVRYPGRAFPHHHRFSAARLTTWAVSAALGGSIQSARREVPHAC